MSSNQTLGSQFKQIHDKYEKCFNQNLKEEGFTLSQISVLIYLARHADEKVAQKDIEQYMKLKHPTVIGILKRLELKGFVKTEPDVKDKRCKNILLTQKAYDLKSMMEAYRDKMEERLIQNMTVEEVSTLKILLGKVLENVAEG